MVLFHFKSALYKGRPIFSLKKSTEPGMWITYSVLEIFLILFPKRLHNLIKDNKIKQLAQP
jgi:hypothetical protein